MPSETHRLCKRKLINTSISALYPLCPPTVWRFFFFSSSAHQEIFFLIVAGFLISVVYLTIEAVKVFYMQNFIFHYSLSQYSFSVSDYGLIQPTSTMASLTVLWVCD